MRALLRILSALPWMVFALVAASVCAADRSTEILELKNRPASELIPLIRPFLADDGAVSGTGFQLIVRTSPANMVEIRRIIASIDRTPRRLMISVRQSDGRIADQRSGSVSGRIPAGDHAELTLGEERASGSVNQPGADVQVTRTRTQADAAGIQQVQVLEGHSASIRVGHAVPVVTRAGSFEGDVTGKHAEFAYRDVTAGFDVLPRTNGDRVTLEIRPYRSSMNSGPSGSIAVSHMHTTISGRLGEWIELGGIAQTRTNRGQGLVFSTNRSDATQAVTLIKVDELSD